ncbi:hypothetical protein A3D00_04780 [Candidatus Woesebacteria bacterium RIFCSPHIGHO2_02_FULL_38_9]|uniref:Cell division protein FtsL n=1 Tax=Candidatus Woesebacteria bacterium RIFCSPHIGHO2_01_FULL_39_28 TaxID=1802496 RepID=A0A1F7YC56_9BACT|nr:MAG: hypothetical protein A2627_02980 [Candidatus Woesebacteria bacterium RIFCSPHIGHO2_01_FULL_39_28]OGM34421.1 MAG: hypothetical protein A3D00_04780 [Candidatus Woesebacteria bacterium RIFCSPHIGHO2_02_FULL_38_9]OGM58011.1 MAG: hypothetical protein A3A50_01990 [Candidatus Woesebacteria bacterium RIFCSPLOWO2_01_FULL_38_20]
MINKKKKTLVFLGLFIITFVASTLCLTILSASKGARLSSIEEEKLTLEKESRELETLLVSNLSLTRASELAGKMGFEKAQKFIYLSSFTPVARR